MEFLYSGLIANYMDVMGTPKHAIDETFNKPDASDVLTDKGVSMRDFGDFWMLVVFQLDDQNVRFMNAYRIYPQMLPGVDLRKPKPIEVLSALMDKYGIEKEIAGYGPRKLLIEKGSKIFFPGILDIDRYLADMQKIG